MSNVGRKVRKKKTKGRFNLPKQRRAYWRAQEVEAQKQREKERLEAQAASDATDLALLSADPGITIAGRDVQISELSRVVEVK